MAGVAQCLHILEARSCVAGMALSVPSLEVWRRACPVWTLAGFVWQVQHVEILSGT